MRNRLQCLLLVSLATTGCTPSTPSEPSREEPTLLSEGGRLPLAEDGNEGRCGAAPTFDPLAFEGAPPPPAGYTHPDLPEEEGGVVYNAAVARALALTYINAIWDADLKLDGDGTLRARLERGVWYLSGPPLAKGSVGGEYYLQICQSNGRVLEYVATQ